MPVIVGHGTSKDLKQQNLTVLKLVTSKIYNSETFKINGEIGTIKPDFVFLSVQWWKQQKKNCTFTYAPTDASMLIAHKSLSTFLCKIMLSEQVPPPFVHGLLHQLLLYSKICDIFALYLEMCWCTKPMVTEYSLLTIKPSNFVNGNLSILNWPQSYQNSWNATNMAEN